MNRVFRLCAATVILIATGCGPTPVRSSGADPVYDAYNNDEMNAAIARARSEVDTFIAALQSGDGDHFSVKAPIDGANGQVEHFWLTDITYADGTFTGDIGNDPETIDTVRFGQSWSIGKEEISDWLIMRGDKMYGNYTVRPLLPNMPPDEAAYIRGMLAE